MSDYTYAEIMKMQDEAVRRVEEMQKRAQAAVGNGVIKENPQKKRAEKSEPKRVPMPEGWLDSLKEYAKSGNTPIEQNNKDISKSGAFLGDIGEKLGKVFGSLNIDGDAALILSLVLLLSEEGCDEALLLSLLYILT